MRTSNNYAESNLQRACIKWFDYQYPQLSQLLFAIPNGGKRGIVTASIMKGEGVRRGVADLMLARTKKIGEYQIAGLFIETKSMTGDQSKYQKQFEMAVVQSGYLYKVVRSFDQFKETIEQYLK